jgi:hypothetical protein
MSAHRVKANIKLTGQQVCFWPVEFGIGLRIVLAIAINGDRREEALSIARPACAAVNDGPMRKLLDDRKLCEA